MLVLSFPRFAFSETDECWQDELLHNPDDSDAEDRCAGRLTPSRLEKLSESVVLNEEHDSTVTGSAKKRSSDVKNLLIKEMKKDLELRPRTMAEEKIRERSVWSWDEEGVIKSLVSIAEGSGWREQVVECFNSAPNLHRKEIQLTILFRRAGGSEPDHLPDASLLDHHWYRINH